MPISLVDYSWVFTWAQAPSWELTWLFFVNVVWIFLLWAILKELRGGWLDYVVGVSNSGRETILLAIDVPRESELTPASMEAIFNQLAGAHGSTNFWEKNWKGEFQEWFSFEIVSIEGYVQYVVWCNKHLRDIVEAAVYAQYPDAEITEIKDYVDLVPGNYPNDTHKMWGAEFKLVKDQAYPIKTYNEFEDRVRGEYIDPMAALLEIMTKIGKGEQIWYQLLAVPIVDSDWLDDAQKQVDKFLNKPIAPPPDNMVQKLVGMPLKMMQAAAGAEASGPEDKSKDRIMSLTPGEKTMVEEMERKLSKIAFSCKLRLVYVGEKQNFNKARGVGPAVGAIKQFNDMGKNNFRPSSKSWVKANYSFKKAREYSRAEAFYNGYKKRSSYVGIPRYVLSTEEMATIYHFPMASVKAPLVKRTSSKKSEPPPVLPMDRGEGKAVEIPNLPDKSKADSGNTDGPPELTEIIQGNSSSNVVLGDADIQFVEIPDEPSSAEASDGEPDTVTFEDATPTETALEANAEKKEDIPTSPYVTGPEPPPDLPTG